MTQKCHLCTITQLCQAISSQLRHLSTVGKKLLKSSVSPTCPHNMVNFGPLTAEICWRVWGHPSKFQRVSCLGSITAQHSSSGRQPDFAVLNRVRHLHSAGRSSRWALARISSLLLILIVEINIIAKVTLLDVCVYIFH